MSQPRARSLIFVILGDCVRVGAREIRLKVLVHLGELVGIAPENMRVLVARMREEGWFDVRRDGRESIYTLTPKTLRTIEDGRRQIFRSDPSTWDGSWSLVIYTVPETDRPTREQLRRDLSWLGFGPLAPATWVSPFRLLDRVADLGASLPNAKLDLLTMRSSGLAADRSIVERCWELDSLNEEYAAFIRELRLKMVATRWNREDGDAAFLQRINLVHKYRRFPFRDPGLPVELQPPGWLGDEGRKLFIEAHTALTRGAEEHYRELGLVPSKRAPTSKR
jgi:phenylacetic acid degradation operon negative regulatory protein